MSESFLMPELEEGIKRGETFTIIPMNRSSVLRSVPATVCVDESICTASLWKKFVAFISIISYIRFFNRKDVVQLNRPTYFYNTIKYLYASSLAYRDLCDRIHGNNNKDVIFYSYWLSYVPIAFALYKHKNPYVHCKFIARGHGSDVYGTSIGVYYPLRDFMIKSLDGIFVISKFGQRFLQKRYPFCANKIYLSRLGVYANLYKKEKDSIIRIVSCSSIIPLKRVDLIFKSIYLFAKANDQYKIEWTHIGDGPLFDKVNNEIKKHAVDNLHCQLVGSLDNKDILELYKNKYFTAFVLLSTTEGIPVSIMEAISSGIPVIATDVGGISEIVNEETGVLIDKDFIQESFDDALNTIINNRNKLAESSFAFFKENFDAVENFKSFITDVNNLKKEPIKVVFIMSFYASQNALKRIEEFKERGYIVEAYGFARNNGVIEFQRNVGVEIIGTFSHSLPYYKRIRTLFCGIHTVIQNHNKENVLYYCFGLDITVIFKTLCGNNYIYEEEDLVYTYFDNNLLINCFACLDRYVVRHSLLTVFTSEGFLLYHYGYLKKDNVVIIPNKLKKEVVNFRPLKRSLNLNNLKVGFVGSFRFSSVFNFAEVFSREFPENEFHFFGSASNTEDQERFEKLSKYTNIIFHGRFRNPQDLPLVYSQIDLLLSTYDVIFENVKYAEPNKIYEAIYFNTPIIATEGTYLGDKINKLGIGYTLNPLNNCDIVNFVKNLTLESYQYTQNNICKLPIDYSIDNYDEFFLKLSKI